MSIEEDMVPHHFGMEEARRATGLQLRTPQKWRHLFKQIRSQPEPRLSMDASGALGGDELCPIHNLEFTIADVQLMNRSERSTHLEASLISVLLGQGRR